MEDHNEFEFSFNWFDGNLFIKISENVDDESERVNKTSYFYI